MGWRWDLFCRVIDNHGDLGISWRLARALAGAGQRVRLWVDQPEALQWMAPQGSPGVDVRLWDEQVAAAQPGEVVVEMFGCDPPAAFVERMAALQTAPVWINVEYLSAEGYVERSHGLPSPHPSGLRKWFFFPGFSRATGGLLRGGLPSREESRGWCAANGLVTTPGERLATLFCYANPRIGELLACLGETPTLLALAPGPAQAQVTALPWPPRLRCIALPWLTQDDYDRLLHGADLNFVRGEDSIVRAIWAGQPFVWQIYPQDDGVHAIKLDALRQRLCAAAPAPLASAIEKLWNGWNGLDPAPLALPAAQPWREQCEHWRAGLLEQAELPTQLLEFVAVKR